MLCNSTPPIVGNIFLSIKRSLMESLLDLGWLLSALPEFFFFSPLCLWFPESFLFGGKNKLTNKRLDFYANAFFFFLRFKIWDQRTSSCIIAKWNICNETALLTSHYFCSEYLHHIKRANSSGREVINDSRLKKETWCHVLIFLKERVRRCGISAPDIAH